MTTHSGLSNDAQAMMAYDAGKKSVGLAFVFWLFTGGVGGHRFYLGSTGPAVFQLILAVLGWTLLIAGVGLFFLGVLGIWLLIDVFLLSGMVQRHNNDLMARLNASARPANSTVDELSKYAALRDSGAITSEEYDAQKARLIGTPAPASAAAV